MPTGAASRLARLPLLPLAAAVGLVGVLVSFKLRTVPVPTDPWHYVLAGSTFPQESWNLVGLTRYGLVLPMMLVTRLFHDSELSYFLLPCLVSGLLVAGCFWLVARFFGRVAGLAAAVLVLANGVVLANASRLYPDVFASAMTVMAVASAVAARDRWRRDQRLGPVLVLDLLLVGVWVGLSWWMRETAVLGWPVVAAVLLWRGGPRYRWSLPLAALPALVLLGVELLVSRWAFGNPWERFDALSGADLSATTNPADLPYLNQSRLTYLLTMPRGFLLFEDGRWMVAMAVLAVIGLLLAPRRLGLLSGWFLLVFLLFTLIGGSLDPAHPSIRLDVARYWVGYLPPMVMAAVGTVAVALRALVGAVGGRVQGGARRAVTVVVGVVAALLVAGPVAATAEGVRVNPTYVVTNGNEAAAFRNWLHEHDREVRAAYSDWMSGRVLPTYTRSFTGTPMSKVRWYSLTGVQQPRRGDYVVLYSAYTPVCFFCNGNVQPWLADHQGDLRRWDLVWQSPERTFVVYRVTERSRPDSKG